MQRILIFAALAVSCFAQTRSVEVASVRPSSFPSDAYFQGWASFSSQQGLCFTGARKATPSGNKLSIVKLPLCGLIALAYDFPGDRIHGMPAWAMKVEPTNFYDVSIRAQGEAPLTAEQARALLRDVLADRFQLKLHEQPEVHQVYELTVAKNGAKLKKVPAGAQPEQNGVPFATYLSMISSFLDRPLVDKTGLDGPRYQYHWDEKELRQQLAESGKPAPSIFSAVGDQLGLALKAVKEEIPELAIDSVEKPTPN